MASTRTAHDNDGSRWIILLLFVVSGVCGLIYEVVWTKQFVAIFGNTVFAASTVLAAFMAGLGLGSVLIGRFADRRADCLRIYGWLEITVGVGGVLVPLAMVGVEAVYVAFARRFDPSFAVLTFVRFSLSFLVVLVPATLMGGTLPVLSRHVVTRLGTAGRSIGALYAFNTFGAFIGTMAAGFLLIRLFGIQRTTALAVVLNLLVGAIALVLHRRVQRRPDEARKPGARGVETCQPTPADRADVSDGVVRLCLVGLGFSGFTALAYEVIFFRGLELVIGTTVYAFATMLATFLAGIALGSALVSLVVDRMRSLVLWLGVLQILIGLSVLGSAALLTKLPITFLHLFAAGVQSWAGLLAIKFTTSCLLLLIPTMLLGANFPVEKCRNRMRELYYADAAENGIPIKPGLAELVAFLKEKSIKYAVATSTARKLTIPKLQLTGLLSTFKIIVAGDEIENGKPAPDIFMAAAKALSIAPEKCVVLEDSSYGIRAAHAAKMIPIMVPDLAQPTNEIRLLTHSVVPSLHEAREVISQLL